MEKTVQQKQIIIMLIDDTPEDLFISNRILEKHAVNKRIITFNSGIPAMEYLQRHQNDIEQIPDIILCDLHMPLMSGYQFLDAYDKLRSLIKSKSKVFILSATSDGGDVKKLSANPNVIRFYEKNLTKEIVDEIMNKTYNIK